MSLSDQEQAFIAANPSAAMTTVAADGTPKVARVGVALVEGQLWSSGTQSRVRTKRLRRDPRCTLFVFDAKFAWLGLETTVTVLDGPDAPDLNIQLFRVMQKRPTGPLSWFSGEMEEDKLRATLVEEGRLIYQFDVHRSYGMLQMPQ